MASSSTLETSGGYQVAAVLHTRGWKLYRISCGEIKTPMTIKGEWEWAVKKTLMVCLKSLRKYLLEEFERSHVNLF